MTETTDIGGLVEKLEAHAAECAGDADNIGHNDRGIYPVGTLLDAARLHRKAASALLSLQALVDEATRKLYRPGVLRCAKCEFRLISSTLDAATGNIYARETMEYCPNDGAPMWRVSWEEECKAADRLWDRYLSEAQSAQAEAAQLREALKPFAGITPSSFYAPDGSEAEGYCVFLANQNAAKTVFTGADLARARAALVDEGGETRAGKPFQARVEPWMRACFGDVIPFDRVERGDRFLEETFELLQSGGYDPARVLELRDYVWGRPVGEPSQEVGGVMVTLAAYCLAFGLDMHQAGETELARIWTKVEAIRAKQAAKPAGIALPIGPEVAGAPLPPPPLLVKEGFEREEGASCTNLSAHASKEAATDTQRKSEGER